MGIALPSYDLQERFTKLLMKLIFNIITEREKNVHEVKCPYNLGGKKNFSVIYANPMEYCLKVAGMHYATRYNGRLFLAQQHIHCQCLQG